MVDKKGKIVKTKGMIKKEVIKEDRPRITVVR